ncbi:YybH family protein [Nonomuraea cavernae]|uniref:YybH family protein n=1 Tax=Nonomuraea cavernae TaxID=2045107 RepID=UPI0033EE58E6
MHQNFHRKSLLLAAVVVPALLAGCAAGGSTSAMGVASPPTETTSPMPPENEMSPLPTGSEMSPGPSESAEQGSPKAAVLAYFEALKAGDADKAVAAYSPEGLAAIQGMKTAEGTDELTKVYKEMLKEKDTATHKIEEAAATGDWAFVRASSEKDGQMMREFFILKKTGNEWKIDRYMNNDSS